MNNILELKGRFEFRKNENMRGRLNLRGDKVVMSKHLLQLADQLNHIYNFWRSNDLIGGALISVHYQEVVAKSNRIQGLFIKGSKTNTNSTIRGSKFEYEEGSIRHVFTHFVRLPEVEESIRKLTLCARVVEEFFDGMISRKDIENLYDVKGFPVAGISKSAFIRIIVDVSFVNRFDIDQDVRKLDNDAIITLYQTGYKTTDVLRKIGIDVLNAHLLDENTILLDHNQIKILQDNVPYLISMQTVDISKINYEDIFDGEASSEVSIPSPTNEPVIGVIDTLFDKNVYFGEWVKDKKLIDENIETTDADYNHGTAVTSIIVDGPNLNPDLDDGCGRFRVKHFAVATKNGFSVFSILKNIRKIVANNSDIKVWNLSLGSEMEIENNFISPAAAELDRIQNEYDVIFVVAGTNRPINADTQNYRLGSPADSLNSLVVNSVKRDNSPASYHRMGPVLSFFNKPDISYYGGDINEKIKVAMPNKFGFVSGTSFATPWIARKIAYLIYNLGLNREVAKALIIDSAAGWNLTNYDSKRIGYGVVPIRIEDIVQSPNDEIRFVLTGTTDAYETYTYRIPVPARDDKHPYYARATLCYFPRCSRNQGVDYTDTEMDIHFGRLQEAENGVKIKSLDRNTQGDSGANGTYEDDARSIYRKWDNIKHIHDTIKRAPLPRKKYGVGNWGLSIKTKHRLTTNTDKGLQFGVVITLKEMYGVNRIEEFMKLCSVRGWIVNPIDIKNRVNVYAKAEEEIRFD